MIKIIKGVYGYADKRGFVVPKTSKDEPFSLTAEQEARLVRLGVAEYVGAVAETPEKPLEDMTAKELRAYAAEIGLEFPANAKKADILAEILEAEASEEDDEPLPEIDAAEAVE